MMSCTGNSWLKTPSMDRIAEKGLRFTKCYTTNPVCVPARYSLMTGKMPSAIGMKYNSLVGVDPWSEEERKEALGAVLKNSGYSCWYGGKVHLPWDVQPEALGYTVYADGPSGEREDLGPKTAQIIRDEHRAPWFITASFINPHDICHHAINELGSSELSRKIRANNAIETAAVNKALSSFDEKTCPPLAENHLPQEDEPEAIQWLIENRPFRKAARELWGERDWKRHRWVYHRLTESVDADIAPIIQALDETGGWDNTIVMFTSDHGDHDGSHKLEHKTALYREAAEVPFIIADPRGRTHETEATPVSNGLDIYATICDYAGVPLPSKRDGCSLKNLLRQGEDLQREEVPIECEVGSAIVNRDYFYARYDFGVYREQLYNLKDDPFQTRNHAGDPGQREMLLKLRKVHRRVHKGLISNS